MATENENTVTTAMSQLIHLKMTDYSTEMLYAKMGKCGSNLLQFLLKPIKIQAKV